MKFGFLKILTADQWVAMGGGLAVIGALCVFAVFVPVGSPWPVIEALAGIGSSVVALGWLLPGRWTAWLWGFGAAGLLIVESAWEYGGLPESAFPFQAMAWVATFLVLMASGVYREGGWNEGLRGGMTTQLVATVGWAAILGTQFRAPVQTAVLDASGALGRFAGAPTTNFWVWVADDFWGLILFRLALGAVLGAVAGFAGLWLRDRLAKPKP